MTDYMTPPTTEETRKQIKADLPADTFERQPQRALWFIPLVATALAAGTAGASQLRARLGAAEVEAKGEGCEQAAVDGAACVHVAAHFLGQQQVVDGLFCVGDAGARDACHVRASEAKGYGVS